MDARSLHVVHWRGEHGSSVANHAACVVCARAPWNTALIRQETCTGICTGGATYSHGYQAARHAYGTHALDRHGDASGEHKTTGVCKHLLLRLRLSITALLQRDTQIRAFITATIANHPFADLDRFRILHSGTRTSTNGTSRISD